MIIARKLLLREIALYIEDIKAYIKLKENTTWVKALSL
jgi:hypothetical protein